MSVQPSNCPFVENANRQILCTALYTLQSLGPVLECQLLGNFLVSTPTPEKELKKGKLQ